MISLPRLILASGSPRRAEILTSVGWAFDKVVADVDETQMAGEQAEDYVVRLAAEKAIAVSTAYSDRIVLGADTTVVIEEEVLGKPSDLRDARRMLRRLSGRWHTVLTGVALVRNGETHRDMQCTRVKFAEMTQGEIDFLAEQGSPLDKAGGYAVQAQAALFIEGIEGDYWNVVGLPVSLVYSLVARLLQ
jgi:septum formation protein